LIIFGSVSLSKNDAEKHDADVNKTKILPMRKYECFILLPFLGAFIGSYFYLFPFSTE